MQDCRARLCGHVHLGKVFRSQLKDIAHLRWDQVGSSAIDITPLKTKKHAIRALVPLHRKVVKELGKLDRICLTNALSRRL